MNTIVEDKLLKIKNDKNGLGKSDILQLIEYSQESTENLQELLDGANQIREIYNGNQVDLCTIMNVKSGKCSEDCSYCSQSAHYKTTTDHYDLLEVEEIIERAKEVEKSGAKRFSLVTSGRSIEQSDQLEEFASIYRRLSQETNLSLCASHGMATVEELKVLKEAGVTMYHHNVETTSYNYSKICKTHEYSDRTDTVKAVISSGLELCSGGIIGMGESMEDRIEMALEIRALGIQSVPINVLMPVKGTPLEDIKVLEAEEILLTLAIYRYLLPKAFIRYAGGRMALKEYQQKGFESGVNAALIGNFLTTIGSCIEEDKEMIINAGLSYK